MATTAVPTFTATIYVGLKDTRTGKTQQIWDATALIQGHVNRVGWCVSVTPTNFVYTDGFEPGVAVGVINYPRFPSTPGSCAARRWNLPNCCAAAWASRGSAWSSRTTR